MKRKSKVFHFLLILCLLFAVFAYSYGEEASGRFVWSKNYKAELGIHIFPVTKYQQLHHQAVELGILTEEDFVEPTTATDSDILKVHNKLYMWKLKLLSLTPLGMLNGENPVSREILRAVKLAVGGTYDASRIALDKGMAMNLAGGFHHAFPGHEEGFCHYNDVAVCIKKLEEEGRISKALVVDCDVHQGNGTAKIFENDDSVFIFDIYQENNYPWPKQKVDLGIGLNSFDNIDDKRYLQELKKLEGVIDGFMPDIVFYLAGADPYKGDLLGGFNLTKEGLLERDRFIIRLFYKKKLPICVLLAGGYALNTNDTIDIHLNTIKVLKAMGGD